MDVVIFVFDLGFLIECDGIIDYDEIEEEGIWF